MSLDLCEQVFFRRLHSISFFSLSKFLFLFKYFVFNIWNKITVKNVKQTRDFVLVEQQTQKFQFCLSDIGFKSVHILQANLCNVYVIISWKFG